MSPSERRDEFVVSIVVPCFNEGLVLDETHRRLQETLSRIGSYEIIYVDDGSSDNTCEVLFKLASGPHVKVIRLSRNFGHQVAATAGLEHSVGDATVLIDADLQDPPDVILEMITKWMSGFDVVYGVRIERKGERSFKRWTAKLFYRLINAISEIPIPVDVGDFRLMDRRVVEAVRAMPEKDRFLRGMVAWAGFRQTSVSYIREPRFAGTTKYSFRKMVRFATDGILSFSIAPLKLATTFGFICAGVAAAGMVLAVVSRLFTNAWVRGWASLFLAILFMGGVQLICLGIIGEYVGRIYRESKGRPLYFVADAIGFGDDELQNTQLRGHDELPVREVREAKSSLNDRPK